MNKERQDLLFQSFIEKDGIFDLNFSVKKRKKKKKRILKIKERCSKVLWIKKDRIFDRNFFVKKKEKSFDR